jgi:hypothetical protein
MDAGAGLGPRLSETERLMHSCGEFTIASLLQGGKETIVTAINT